MMVKARVVPGSADWGSEHEMKLLLAVGYTLINMAFKTRTTPYWLSH